MFRLFFKRVAKPVVRSRRSRVYAEKRTAVAVQISKQAVQKMAEVREMLSKIK